MAYTALHIAVGQVWQTRGGGAVKVTKDRAELDDDKSMLWRWALSNSHIADRDGRCGTYGQEHDSDLVQLIEEAE